MAPTTTLADSRVFVEGVPHHICIKHMPVRFTPTA